MLDDDQSVSDTDKFFEIFDEQIIITWVKSDRWFVENIGNSLKSRTNLCRETNPLGFSSREGVASSCESDVSKSYVLEKPKSVDTVFEDFFSDLFLLFAELEFIKIRQ